MENNIGKKIYEYRKKHEMSQGAFAELCGIDRSYLTQIENGKRKPGKKTENFILWVLNNE